MSDKRIGFIGLGNMGAPMAQRLLAWPGGLTVCDTRPEVVRPFTEAGARAVASAAAGAPGPPGVGGGGPRPPPGGRGGTRPPRR
ncbi:NAD(P)-binding domain-containing protein, partial [Nocardia farcinica]|uniref:NAD(P)-binding domain-containing protein n=1 Tax=Nocardia farcinica TaxID=37329 RepID=UPI002454840C